MNVGSWHHLARTQSGHVRLSSEPMPLVLFQAANTLWGRIQERHLDPILCKFLLEELLRPPR